MTAIFSNIPRWAKNSVLRETVDLLLYSVDGQTNDDGLTFVSFGKFVDDGQKLPLPASTSPPIAGGSLTAYCILFAVPT